MVKKRGAPKRTAQKSFDGGGSRVKAVNTWEEMEHDAEDDFHDSRGKILLDHEQDLARRYQDDDEASEEEVYGLDSEEEEEDDEELSDLDNDLGGSKDQDEDEMDLDKKSWGKGKRSYYDAEEVESDEETAKAEEEEALRLQKKRLQEMSEEDFAPEEEETVWGDRSARGLLGDKDADRAIMEGFDKELAGIDLQSTSSLAKTADGQVVVEKIAKANLGKLSKKEVLKVLQNQSPELLDLVEEFKDKIEALQAVAEVLQMVSQLDKPLAQDRAPLPFLRLKYQTLANYLTNIAFYIALKSSPGTDALELREHPVIDALVELRTMLGKLDKLENKKSTRRDMEDLLEILEVGGEDQEDEEESEQDDEEALALQRLEEAARLVRKAKKAKKAKLASTKGSKQEQPFEYNVELEDDFVSYNAPTKKSKKSSTTTTRAPSSTTLQARQKSLDDDYGDLDALLDIDLEDKAQKKRSLRDYVAKVDQAVNKRSKILRGSGDTDIPYRDRFKDRQEQQKRKAAQQGPEPENADLDDLDWDEKDRAAARMVAGDDDEDRGSGSGSGGKAASGRGSKGGDDDDDEDFDGAAYYEAVVAAKEAKKAARKALSEAMTSETAFEDTSIDPNDKRSVSWQILKNKGLTPHRKKEQRNPRVKHRNKYETAKKKIKSVKRVFTRLEGAYGGEKTGIKTGLARSVKFS